MTRFVREGRGRKREHAVQLFGDSSTVAFNSWLRFTQRIFLHGTGEEEQEEEEEQQLPLARKRRERERERVLVSRFVPVVRFFAFSDQTAKPRLIRPVFLFLPFDCLSSLPSFYIIFELIGFPFPVVAPDLGQPARLNRSEK